MWKIARVNSNSPKEVSKYLKKGYEPFTVTVDNYGETIWFKKKEEVKKSAICD